MTIPEDASELRVRAQLAHIRQKLLAPARAILGYQELVTEEVRRLGLEGPTADLDRVHAAAETLHSLADRLLDFGGQRDPGAGSLQTDLESRLRHDLRTPLNAIIGYSELVLEDLDGVAAEKLRPDLERLLAEARQLLGFVETIIDLSQRQPDPERDIGLGGGLVTDLRRALRPALGLPRASSTARILVVDDDQSNRQLLARRLEHEGHAVVTAESGRGALDILRADTFDVILLDLMMPDMNGLELLQELRARERWRRVPVIMISGLSATEAVVRCIEAGAEDYLPKPFDPVILRARINACLERKRWRDREEQYLKRIEAEKERADALLCNILPGQIVARLNDGEQVIADRFDEVTILFADLVGFTPVAARMSPTLLVDRLNRIFTAFDGLVDRFGAEKIKTIGDAYMAAAGLPQPRPDHADVIARLALAMKDELDRIDRGHEGPFELRIGIHTGPVVAGIIGRHRFIYDVWGDTVNVASRLESHSAPDQVQISDATRRALTGRYRIEPRGTIDLRGMGGIPAFFLGRAVG